MAVVLTVRPALSDATMADLFAAAWDTPAAAGRDVTRWRPILARSLTWVAAHRDGRLVGFVNVVGDGGRHAFVLDTTVHPGEQRSGLGTRLVRAAAGEARAAGAEWLHVDYEEHLTGFYAGCGFRPTAAGLLRLAPA
ncbi:MAG TPA: GNAT family N-acetyltransferase [Actinocatenispora sp.]